MKRDFAPFDQIFSQCCTRRFPSGDKSSSVVGSFGSVEKKSERISWFVKIFYQIFERIILKMFPFRFVEVLRSYKPKPERTSFVARRLVESHLGKKTSTSTDQRLEERKKIERAKGQFSVPPRMQNQFSEMKIFKFFFLSCIYYFLEQKKFIAQMREDVWEGRV